VVNTPSLNARIAPFRNLTSDEQFANAVVRINPSSVQLKWPLVTIGNANSVIIRFSVACASGLHDVE
jgi:hypothetical protein